MGDKNFYYINEVENLLPILSQFGLFLEEDYEKLINNSIIPINFSPSTHKTSRKIVLIGSDNTPLLVSKSIFLALQLSGAETLDIKPSSLDEALLAENIIKNNNTNHIKTTVHVGTDIEVELSTSWRDVVENATDIVVFGNYQIIEYYKTLENEHRRVHLHEDKISFGVINSNNITDTLIDNLCLDFFNFYGVGTLSPKFYITIGEMSLDVLKEIDKTYTLVYGEQVEEFRSKLNIIQRTNLMRFSSHDKAFGYINLAKNVVELQLNDLFGDIKILSVKSIKDVDKLISVLHDNISTISVNPVDTEILSVVESNIPPRICDIGTMHSLGFWESMDNLSDFDVYNNY